MCSSINNVRNCVEFEFEFVTPPPSPEIQRTAQRTASPPAPLATLGAEADLRFSGTLYDYLVEFNLERYTINRQRTEQRATIEEIRKKIPKLDLGA
jgi:hypothetical protein